MKAFYVIPALVIVAATALSSVFTVDEREKVLVLQFGEIKQVIEDADRVAVYSHLKRAQGAKYAVVHILRFAGDKIVELWDVGQEVPEDSLNASHPWRRAPPGPRRARGGGGGGPWGIAKGAGMCCPIHQTSGRAE